MSEKTVVINQHCDDHLAWARLQDRRQVYIGRGSPWGNPYTHLKLSDTRALWKVRTRAEAISKYETWLMKHPELLARLPELRGAILVCHCHPLPCHGDVLIRLLEALDG